MKKEFVVAGLVLILAGSVCFARQPSQFKEIDANKDGRASLDELDAWFKARSEEYPDKFPYMPNQAKATLEKLDKNGDGVLSEEEWVSEDITVG